MVAYDSRRTPDQSQWLRPETIETLRAALAEQAQSGSAPVPSLREAIRLAGEEARSRTLPPEALLIQLKTLADEAGVSAPGWDAPVGRTHVRQWMVAAMLRAYWGTSEA